MERTGYWPAQSWLLPAFLFMFETISVRRRTIFYAGGDVRGGSGVIVLPCGAARHIVGIAAMALMQRSTLVLTTSITRRHRTVGNPRDPRQDSPQAKIRVGEYTGEKQR